MVFSFQTLITPYCFLLQILVSALMTVYLWHQAQAQINPLPPPVPPPVPANAAGYVYIIVPAAVPNPLAGATGVGVLPVLPTAPLGAPGTGLNFAVSKILNVH
jgi:uncharacterized iron-regulated membrane protein